MRSWAAAAVIVVPRAGWQRLSARARLKLAWTRIHRPGRAFFLVSHTREGIRKHGVAHKGGIKPLCASDVS